MSTPVTASKRPQRPLQLASTDVTLQFLQTEYEKFRAHKAELQAQILEFNELVRQPLEKPELTLRVLYIDLLMHDEMIRHSQATHDTKRERIAVLMRNKVALQQMIRQREAAEECVVPDPRTEQKNHDLVALLNWFPEAHRSEFRQQLQPVWRRWQTKKISTQELLQTVVQKCVVLGCRSVEDFRALFSIIEWVLHTQTASEEKSV